MSPTTTKLEFSAKVRLWLQIDDLCVGVAQVGDGSLILTDRAAKIAFTMPLFACLITFVDGEEVEFQVAPRERVGSVIYFNHCFHRDPDRELLDMVPF